MSQMHTYADLAENLVDPIHDRATKNTGGSMSTTQTGIPIIDCETCGYRHPITRQHCPTCGKASLFGHKNCGWEKRKAKR